MKLAFFSILISITLFNISSDAQTSIAVDLPYYEIPDYPDEYTAENVAARMIDGLGFRYYWATEGLRTEDLEFKPNAGAREVMETIEHIHGLVEVIYNSVLGVETARSTDTEKISFDEMRKSTLMRLLASSEKLKSGERKLEDCLIVFKRGDNRSEFPFWNNINGPIADALWHCGQIVSFRRSSGNPFNSNASVFTGKVRK